MSPLPKRLTRKRLLLGIVGIGTLALVPVAVAAYADGADDRGPTRVELTAAAPKVGAPAPAFTAVDTRGASHSLGSYRGRWVVLEWVNHSCPYTKKHYKSVDGAPANFSSSPRSPAAYCCSAAPPHAGSSPPRRTRRACRTS